ncbi:MAG: hypothetical protein NC930_00380 [Candidatus Omnitrophica bacterium]|nr:hypothetical protein [Candidatus Omnitrophota bacterium]
MMDSREGASDEAQSSQDFLSVVARLGHEQFGGLIEKFYFHSIMRHISNELNSNIKQENNHVNETF